MRPPLLVVMRCTLTCCALLSFAALGCDDAITAGSVGTSCSKDTDCHDGLVCLSQICVSPPGASAGSGGAGGSGGSAGSSGNAGSGGNTAGAGGGCNASNTRLAPQSGLIADFADPDGGLEIMGAVYEYGGGASNLNAPTVSFDGATLHVTENAAATGAPQYVGIYMSFDQCIDASAYTGVKFTISGSFAGCTMQFFSIDAAHQDSTTGAVKATGPAGSYPPQYALASSQVSSTPQTIQVPFTGQAGGSPPTPLDGATLIAEGWQFTIPAALAGSVAPDCVADLTIDDLTFF